MNGPSYAVWCIAETLEAAGKAAILMASGSAPLLYASEDACLVAWRCQPSFAASVYHPWRCGVVCGLEGVYIRSTSRLDHGGAR